MTKAAAIILFFALSAGFRADALALPPQDKVKITSTAAVWDGMTETQKAQFIAGLIQMFKDDGVAIRKEPEFYVREIELMRADNARNFTAPIGAIFKLTAIIYKDFDNGQDPYELILENAGEKEYRRYIDGGLEAKFEEKYDAWKASVAGSEELEKQGATLFK